MQNDNSLILNFVVNNQTIVRNDNNIIIENSQNYLKARFEFSSEWEECTKIAKFEYNNKCYSSKFINENECYIPSEVIKSPYFNIALVGYGTNNIVKITTGYYLVEVGETCVHSGQYANVTNIISNTLDIKKSGNVVSIETKGNQPQEPSEPSEPQEPIDVNLLKEVTYDELVALRNNNQLVAGQMYRIIDYVTTSMQKYTSSAYHQFDIIVTALSTNQLSENARAIAHKGDTYFEEVVEHIEVSGDPYLPSDFTIDKLEVAYTMYVDYNEQYNNQEIEGLARNDIFVEFSYKENNEGKLVPVLYKTDRDLLEDEGTDYADTYYFVDKYTYNGVTHDRWRKIEDEELIWDDEGKIYALTNQVVEIQNYSETITYKTKQYANLMAWKIKYCLDNDTERFAWASNHNIDMLHTDDDIWFEYGGEIEVNGVKYHKWVSNDFDEEDACLLIDTYDFIKIEAQNLGGEHYNYDEYRLNKYNENSGNFEEGYSGVSLDENEGSPYKDLYYIPKGKGVIYYMKDEYNNECPYDFKNILFKRYQFTNNTNEIYDKDDFVESLLGRYASCYTQDDYLKVTDSYRYFYTYSYCTKLDFSDLVEVSIFGYDNPIMYFNNIIGRNIKEATNCQSLNNIVFIIENSRTYLDEYHFSLYNNIFNRNCFENTITIKYDEEEDNSLYFHSNTFNGDTKGNIFYEIYNLKCEGNCYENRFIKRGEGIYIKDNIYWCWFYDVVYITLHNITNSSFYTCTQINIGKDASGISLTGCDFINIGSAVVNSYISRRRKYVTIGNNCSDIKVSSLSNTNAFSQHISIGNSCEDIYLSEDAYGISIGDDCSEISLNAVYTNIGNSCSNIKKISDAYNGFINIGNYVRNVKFDNCIYITIGNNNDILEIKQCTFINIGNNNKRLYLNNVTQSNIGDSCLNLTIKLNDEYQESASRMGGLNILTRTRGDSEYEEDRLIIDPIISSNSDLVGISFTPKTIFTVELINNEKLVVSYKTDINTIKGCYKLKTDTTWTEF